MTLWRSAESCRQLFSGLITPILNGQKASLVVSPPNSGRSTVLRQLVYEPELYSTDAAVLMKQCLWVVVNVPAGKRLVEYILESPWLGAEDQKKLEDAGIEKWIKTVGKRIVFVVNSLDSEVEVGQWRLVREMMGLYYLNFNKVAFVFAQGREEVEDAERLLGEVFPYTHTNKNYFPLYALEEVKGWVKQEKQTLDVERLYGWSGGHVMLWQRLLEVPDLLEDRNIALEDKIIMYFLELIWDSCAEDSQGQLKTWIKGGVPKWSEYLVKTRLVKQEGRGWRLFSPLFELWLKTLVGTETLMLEEREGELWLDGTRGLLEEMAYQEYEVLKALWARKGEVVTRSEVAEVLWPKDTDDNYSDWAIDQIICKIRRKLGDFGKVRKLKTIKGKGFVLAVV